MAEEVKLPQLGESVTEGIILEWLVDEGDTVEQDQPLFELSTDKIDTEVPSPVAGVLKEKRAAVDDTVEVGQVIAIIETDAEVAAEPDEAAGEPDEEPAAEEPSGAEDADEAEVAPETEQAAEAGAGTETQQPQEPAADQPSGRPTQPTAAGDGAGNGKRPSGEAALTSPLVRKLLREHDLAADQVEGTGQGGRITREDVERTIAEGPREPARPPAERPAAAAPSAPERRRPEPSPRQVEFAGREHTEELSRVRKAIARHMHESMQTTAQLTAVVEADVSRIMAVRARHKDAFKATHGVSLSPLPVMARAAIMTLPRHPVVNASIDTEGGTATFHNYVNLGIAVDTEHGLIVPNIKDAQDLTIPALAKRIGDIAERARSKKLAPDEIAGGTFTITNTGSRGAMIDTPILNPPEVAILATTLIEKRPIVVETDLGDTIAIRHMTYLCLTYDHRMVDGADAARFLVDYKDVLENHDFEPELGV